jgi:hypothetical protein
MLSGRPIPNGAAENTPMATHKFQVGQVVFYTPPVRYFIRDNSGGVYKIAERLPEQDGEAGYRIVGRGEMPERSVRESELCELDEAPYVES